MRQIIDFHLHAGNYAELRTDIQELIRKIPLEDGVDVAEVFSNTDKMEAYLSRVGVVRSVMLAECGPGTNFSITSELIANRCKGSQILVPFGSVNPQFHTDAIAEFERSLEVGVKGFKFYPADHDFDALSETMMSIYQRCEENNLVIMFHTGFTAQKDTSQQYCNPAEFIPILEAFPKLKVLFCHAGKPHWYDDTVTVLKQYDNAYIDTALVPVEVVKSFVDHHPEIIDKIIFGSDWPVCGNYENLLQRYEQAGFTEAQLDQILSTNGLSLINQHIV
ncbi:MAG: putative TIM-barrel fold metal-dependent hydrolase [Paraglaciecola sp.]|jgi:predicted TIM-barrel fold metal-dependent hydrolase